MAQATELQTQPLNRSHVAGGYQFPVLPTLYNYSGHYLLFSPGQVISGTRFALSFTEIIDHRFANDSPRQSGARNSETALMSRGSWPGPPIVLPVIFCRLAWRLAPSEPIKWFIGGFEPHNIIQSRLLLFVS